MAKVGRRPKRLRAKGSSRAGSKPPEGVKGLHLYATGTKLYIHVSTGSKNGSSDLIASALCAECQERARKAGGEEIAFALLWPPIVPREYARTHGICGACLALRRLADRHHLRCELLRAGLRLTTGGWETPYSEALRRDLRARVPRWTGIIANVLGHLVRPYLRPDAVLVSVPMSSGADGRDVLLDLTKAIGERVGVPALRALVRTKIRSTRQSVAQIRRRIAGTEYRVDPKVASSIPNSTVILLDDTVTTGLTLVATARLLRVAGAAAVIPVTLDRIISSRLRQRLGDVASPPCPHVSGRIRAST